MNNRSAIITLWPSGNKLDLLNPDPKMIDMCDIAHSLARQCRFTGHVKYFYSVLQHSMQVALLVKSWGGNRIEQLTALLHDASEYGVGDLNKPLKDNVEFYKKVENRLQKVIAEKYGLIYPYPDIIHEADLEARKFEAYILKHAPPHLAPDSVYYHASSPLYAEKINFDRVNELFMQMYAEVSK